MSSLLLLASLAYAQGLTGFLLDEQGRPLRGATVEAAGLRVLTDEDGAFTLPIDAGTLTVSLTPQGAAPLTVDGVLVLPGYSTELLVTVGAPPVWQIEAPDASVTKVEEKTGPPGTIIGIILDEDSGRPLTGVRVFVRGTPVEAMSDKRGAFRVEIPEGAQEITTIRAGYGTESTPVEVVAHEERSVEIRLARAGLQLADVTIRAPRIQGGAASLLDERQEASSVSDVLGSEQMSRSGDTDAAAALRRVTGLTVIGGKYVYVRGLGDRYSATLLNGSSLPSPEPERRVVPLDLFPTSLIEAVVIQKTFSPDRPAEFGGGVVEVRTRSIPDDPLFSVSVSGSYDAGTSFAESPFGASGPTDWLGFGAEHRALPDELAEASAESPIKAGGIFSPDGYTDEDLERFGELITDRWSLSPRTLPPDFGLNLSAGGELSLGEKSLGALAGIVFSNGWDIEEGFKATYSSSGDGLELKRETTFTETQNRVRLGGALNLGLEGERGQLGSTTLLMRSSTGTALTYDANDPTGSNDTHVTRIDWEEQQLLFEQITLALEGERFTLGGRAAFSWADRVQPDKREYTYLATSDGLILSQRGGWNEILYGVLNDRTMDLGLDLTAHLGKLDLKTGGQLLYRDRASTTRRFAFQFQGSEGIDLSADVSDVLVPSNIGAEEEGDLGYLELEENTTSSDDYGASQLILATFLQGDVAWTARLRSLVGLRLERSNQEVSTFELFDTSLTPVKAELSSLDLLPAATLSFGLGPEDEPDRLLARFGYGRTLSRPELRELSEVAYYDYRSGRLLYGNPDLERATIDNLDLRWEWYPRAGESVSLGAFFKYFDEPIESVIAVSAVSGSVGTFANANSATNFGAELEARKRLDFIAPALTDFYVSANGSVIRSRVDLSGTEGNQTSETRPLQGQSPWVLNGQLGYENPDRKTAVSLLYNVFGPRIVSVGTSGIPDTYEEPVHRLDLVASQGFGEGWSARLKGTNLLDWPVRETTGDQVSQETRDGWSIGLGLGWSP